MSMTQTSSSPFNETKPMHENQEHKALVKRLFNRTGDTSKDVAHAVLGVVTEVYELRNATDSVNALEELGDLLFFLQALTMVVSEHLNTEITIEDPRLEQAYLDIHTQYGGQDPTDNQLRFDLLNDTKRWVGYGKEPENLFEMLVKAAMYSLKDADLVYYDIDSALEANIAKLNKRYPKGRFDANDAINRNLEQERAALTSV